MAKHPQNSVRGLLFKGALGFGSTGIFALAYSEGTAVIAVDTTGVMDLAGDLSIGGSGKDMSQDSTGVLDLPSSISLSGSGKDISQTSTSIFIPGSLSLLSAEGGTAVLLAGNSTGLTIAVGTGAAAQITVAA